jgi:nicotinamide mononucleotide adenylyltransferase
MGRVRSRTKTRWTAEERQIAMEQRLRAQTIPARRGGGPSIDEWDDEEVDYEYDKDTGRR